MISICVITLIVGAAEKIAYGQTGMNGIRIAVPQLPAFKGIPYGRALNTRLGPQDFRLVARGLGCNGVRVNEIDEFRSALTGALSSDIPSVIDCDIDVSDALIAHEKPELITLGFKKLTLEARQTIQI